MKKLHEMTVQEANAERARRVAEREAKVPRVLERRFMAPADVVKADRIQSASESLNTAVRLLSQHESHLVLFPHSEAAQAAYSRLYNDIETAAKELATLTGNAVPIPQKLELAGPRFSRSIEPTDWLDDEKPASQPRWMATPESRAKHSADIAAERAQAAELNRLRNTGVLPK